jgi:integrase
VIQVRFLSGAPSHNLKSSRRVKQIINRVMAFAVTEGMTQGNPASHIQNRDSFERRKTKHHPAIIEPVSFGGLLLAIRGYTGSKTTHNTLELSPLVFVRPGEMRLAEWSEFDLNKAVWEARVKMMQAWSDYLDLLRIGGQVIPLNKAA